MRVEEDRRQQIQLKHPLTEKHNLEKNAETQNHRPDCFGKGLKSSIGLRCRALL